MKKLNELAAKAMGWKGTNFDNSNLAPNAFWVRDDSSMLPAWHWNPSASADDALILLEKKFGAWFLKAWKGGYSCGPLNGEWAVTAVTVPLAMTLCALRASGVSETEIQDALK